MARQVRIEYPGAVYHCMARGNRREEIVSGDGDREAFVALFEELVGRTGWRMYSGDHVRERRRYLKHLEEVALTDGGQPKLAGDGERSQMKLLRFTPVLVLLLLWACSTTNPRPSREEPDELDCLNYRDDHGNHLGCSWYCGAPPIRVSATSTFRDGIYSFSPANAHDSKKETVWVESAEGNGIGERLIFSFDLPKLAFSPGRVHEVAFELADVYPGTEHEDTALADFFFSGFGVH